MTDDRCRVRKDRDAGYGDHPGSDVGLGAGGGVRRGSCVRVKAVHGRISIDADDRVLLLRYDDRIRQ
ncbi:hypothetical protein [Streptomyces sp. NPDC001537]